MNRGLVDKIANAVLYEGYMLYPYTASATKNRKRWNFGVLYPPGFDTNEMQTECLALADDGGRVDVRIRFLQLVPGDETVEREVELPAVPLVDSRRSCFRFDGAEKVEGEVGFSAVRLKTRLWRISVRIRNATPGPDAAGRDDALARSLIATHTILTLHGGDFISLTDPPGEYREAAAACRNAGAWPVLCGTNGERDTMLSSPIILYDYPQIAPESAGDLFDSTEIDEILTLRILTLSDEEKLEIRRAGGRASQILERTEALPPEQLIKMHGAWRSLKQEPGFKQEPNAWDPESGSAKVDSLHISGTDVRQGGRVRLRPNRSADILDIALAGKIGVIEAIEQDFDGRVHLAIVLEDDPGRDLGMLRQPGHRFFFSPEEVEPVS